MNRTKLVKMDRTKIDLTRGNVLWQVIWLSWPVVVAMAMQTGYNLVDMFWVGRLGPSAVAAVSLCGFLFFLVLAVGQTLGSGTIALVARFYGEKNYSRAEYILLQSLLLTVVFSITLALGIGILARPILIMLGGSPEVISQGTTYLRIVAVGFFFQIFSYVINYAMRGTGDMKTPMRIMLVATIINIILDPLLIFGPGFFPAWGVAGAAAATAISMAVSCFYAAAVLLRGRSFITLKIPRILRPDSGYMRLILAIGLPVGISYTIMSFSNMALFRIVATYGTPAIGAQGIGFRIVQMATLPVVAIAAATTTLVGQNLGARDQNRARDSAFKALLVSSIVMVFFSLFFFGMAYPLISIFTPHTQIRTLGRQFLRIISFSQLFAGATITLGGVFRGAGDTKPPMLVGLGKLGLLVLLANLFSRYLFGSVEGVWWAMNICTGLETMVLFWWFHNGKWQEKEITSFLPIQE